MSKTNSFETNILELIFKNTALENIGDASGLQGSSSAGNLYVALFTADPTETGAQTNEADFTGYARQSVARGAGWTVSSGEAENAAAITFPECTAGSNTITHFAIMTAATSGDMLYSAALDADRAVSSGTTLEFAAGNLTITED